jgi:hypothetical protein
MFSCIFDPVLVPQKEPYCKKKHLNNNNNNKNKKIKNRKIIK